MHPVSERQSRALLSNVGCHAIINFSNNSLSGGAPAAIFRKTLLAIDSKQKLLIVPGRGKLLLSDTI